MPTRLARYPTACSIEFRGVWLDVLSGERIEDDTCDYSSSRTPDKLLICRGLNAASLQLRAIEDSYRTAFARKTLLIEPMCKFGAMEDEDLWAKGVQLVEQSGFAR